MLTILPGIHSGPRTTPHTFGEIGGVFMKLPDLEPRCTDGGVSTG
jgi:hypothetical protein